MLAYLVIREDAKWTDVFRLVPGRTVTIGRASTNQIVVKDERCSRCHAEIFFTGGNWTVRDLDSRNGTLVGAEPLRLDYHLQPGDVVRIAHCQLAFVHDLSEAFNDGSVPPPGFRREVIGEETVIGKVPEVDESTYSTDDSNVLATLDVDNITHRRRETTLLDDLASPDEMESVPRFGRDAKLLCRLAFEMGDQHDERSVCNLALNGLFQRARVDAGAVLVCPRGADTERVTDLRVLVSRSDNLPTYYRVSDFVAETVLRDGEAVLARNVADDSTLASRDSKGMIFSTGVICAPLKIDSRIVGLIHLYSTDAEVTPDPDDLDFTLSVAKYVGMALARLDRQQELADNLSKSQHEIVELRKRLGAESELVGSSPTLARVQHQIQQAAPSRATVLIRGESGVGKELVARAVHYASPRKSEPFVCLNCAALTETLLESELFGHERGAFTGATERKIGKFEASHKGTLMLDEIGEMSPTIQAKFLRVLEGHAFERVGGSKSIKVDVRVIAATNRDLEKAVNDGAFRRDLFFRLHVIEIQVPPLRKRGNDVMELAHFFLERYRAETGRRLKGFTAESLEHMRRYRWPGNIRELKNVIERAVVLAREEYIAVDDLNLTNLATIGDSGEIPAPRNEFEPTSLAEMEKRHILATLHATNWNKSRSAGILGIERSTLDRKIRRYELAPKKPAAGRS